MIVAAARKGVVLWLFPCGVAVGWLVGLSVSPVVHIVLTSVIALVVGLVSTLAGLKYDPGTDEHAGLQVRPHAPQYTVDPRPVVLMLIGLAAGASAGIYARTNGWFGPNVHGFVQEWAPTGLSEKTLTRLLLNNLYPADEPVQRVDAGFSTYESPPDSRSAHSDGSNSQKIDTTTHAPHESQPMQKMTGNDARGHTGVEHQKKESGQGRGTSTAGLFTVSDDDCARLREARSNEKRLRLLLTNSSDEKLSKAAGKCTDLSCLQQLLEEACTRK
ncbi:MAG: hypothetical protein JWQ98_1065 [Chlorobi bacterium]|nr:hypothetical protein [Chlorobiota bacterium]